MTGSWIESFTLALGKSCEMIRWLLDFLGWFEEADFCFLAICNTSGKCLGSRSMDGEVHTKLAYNRFEFRSPALSFLE